MKRKAIFSLSFLLISIFLFQISTLMVLSEKTLETPIEIIDHEIELPVVNVLREFVLHFDSRNTYNSFVESYSPRLEFPGLKMVMLDDWLFNRPVLESIVGVKGVFDLTDSQFHFIEPTEDTEYIYSGLDGVKKTVQTKDMLNLQPLWSDGYKGAGTVLYDIDTGINIAHVDFTGRINFTLSKSFIETIYGFPTNNPSLDDTNGHGTHTAGTAAGAGIANPDYIGMAPEAEIIVARTEVLGDSGIPPASLLAAMDYAIILGKVDVLTYSISGGDREGISASEAAMTEIVESGVVVCCAVGNDDDYYYMTGAPASAPQTIGVAATAMSGSPAAFSNFGPTQDSYVKPDLAAPGTGIWSCYIGSSTAYASLDGTSMATPHIAGSSLVLVDALKELGIQYDAGLVKAALMKSASIALSGNYLSIGAGVPNINDALLAIQAATANASGFPVVLWALPEFPIQFYETLPQGFHGEFFIDSVSSTPQDDLAPVVSGNITSIVTLNTTPWTEPWTKNYYLSIDVPDAIAPGIYDGDITFETNGVTATTHLEITVVEGKGKILYSKKHTDYSFDFALGQYILPVGYLLQNGYALNEYKTWNITGERNEITDVLLSSYDCIWLADPFNIHYPNGYSNPYKIWPAHTSELETVLANEILAIQNFVAAGGGLLLDFLGETTENIGGLLKTTGMHVGTINDLLDPYGIVVSDNPYAFTETEIAKVITTHAITEGVKKVDHYGTTLSVTGDAQIIAEYDGEGTVAIYENSNGGRVVTMATNFILDTSGYQDQYHTDTNNELFCNNIFDWLLADEKIVVTHTEDDNGVSFEIKSIIPSATLTATLEYKAATTTTDTVNLVDVGGGDYTYRLDYGEEGIYKFWIESVEDKYLNQFVFDSTIPVVIDTGGWENYTVPEIGRIDFTVQDASSIIKSVSIKINGESVNYAGIGTRTITFSVFSSSFTEELNVLDIVAVDAADNKLETSYIIPLTEPESTSLPAIAVVLSLLSMAALVSIFRRKNR
ncbi:MAG: S8 family serine peptidase [Asgard group archaeon]|nr:S8 family serine peptidase [Asgard group archaeon]